MNRYAIRVRKMWKVRVVALAVFSCCMGSSSLLAADVASSTVFPTEMGKENADKIITNVKASYNPVVEQIVVSFKLAKQSAVTIKLMDALGNEVLHLYSGNLDEGNQNHLFETNEKVAPGFYFLRVASGSETVVKRISIK